MLLKAILPMVMLLGYLPCICAAQFIFQIDDPPSDQQPAEVNTESTVAEQELPPAHLARKASIERCLAIYYTRQIDADVLRPWSLMHGLIAFGDQSRVITANKSVKAVEYLCNNGIGDDRKLMIVHNGKLYLPVGPGYQGHEGQLLAMLAQSGVPPEHPLNIDEHSFTVADLIEYEKSNCRDATELTFKLIGLSHYLDSDATWTNDLDETWSIARLIEQELSQPIVGAACGGTHRLMGLSYAVVQREAEDQPLNGQWARAARYITEFQEYTFSLQNKDGSFSTQFFEGRSDAGSANTRLLTSGHILEWLVFSLPSGDLEDPRLERGVDYLVNLMMAAPDYKLDVGPRGHALRALALYETKIYGSSDRTQLMPKGIIRVKEAVTAPVVQVQRSPRVSPASHSSTKQGSSASRTSRFRRFNHR